MAQERTEAQKIAQGEVESLDAMYATNKSTLIKRTKQPAEIPGDATKWAFCRAAGAGNGVTVDDNKIIHLVCNKGAEGRYHTTTVAVKDDPDDPVFKTTATWENLSGRNEQVTIYYRVREPENVTP